MLTDPATGAAGLTSSGTGRVPDALAPPPRHPRFPLLDGLRAIAALSVLTFHAHMFGGPVKPALADRLLAHLNVGVTVFFVLSGFLLYRPLLSGRTGGPPAPRTRAYARNRALRIYPAFAALVIILLAAPQVSGLVTGTSWQDFGLLSIPVSGCLTAPGSCALGHGWSLVAEVTFYLSLPLYSLGLGRLARSHQGPGLGRALPVELAALAALSLLAFLLRFWVTYPWSLWLGTSAPAYVLWFAVGMGLAVVSVDHERRRLPLRPAQFVIDHPTGCWLLAGVLYALLCVRLPANPYLATRFDSELAFGGFALVAGLLVAPAVLRSPARPALVHRFLGHRWLGWLGLVSYGIFLWHYVVALNLGSAGAGAGFPVVLSITLALAVPLGAASYYLIERPALRLKSLRPRAASRGG